MTQLPHRAVTWSQPWIARLAALVGAAGLIGVAIGIATAPARTGYSYLAACVYALGIALGGLVLVLMQHLIGARWFVAVRRLAEAILTPMPLLAVLFLPVLFVLHATYPWTEPAALAPHARELLARKSAYLNVPFFVVRTVVYLATWTGIAVLVRRWSIRQDADPDGPWLGRQQALAAPALIAIGFTLTFAAFDWVMSLDPTWYSTIFGIQIFAGGLVGTLALLAALVHQASETGVTGAAVGPSHVSAIGKLLFTLVIFWAYASFSQLLIIWIGDLPVEAAWYTPRLAGSWGWLGVVLIAGHFAVPFVLLLSYRLKRRAAVLGALGLWMLAMHYLDVYWTVLPSLTPDGVRPHWLDVASLAAVIGSSVAWTSWRMHAVAALPVGDPDLPAAARYHET